MNGNSTTQNEAECLEQPYFNVTANTGTPKSFLFHLCRQGRSGGGHKESTTMRECLHLAHASQAPRLL